MRAPYGAEDDRAGAHIQSLEGGPGSLEPEEQL